MDAAKDIGEQQPVPPISPNYTGRLMALSLDPDVTAAEFLDAAKLLPDELTLAEDGEAYTKKEGGGSSQRS